MTKSRSEDAKEREYEEASLGDEAAGTWVVYCWLGTSFHWLALMQGGRLGNFLSGIGVHQWARCFSILTVSLEGRWVF